MLILYHTVQQPKFFEFEDDVTFSRIMWKWSWFTLVRHNPNCDGIEGFFLDGYKEWSVYGRVYPRSCFIPRDLDDTQQRCGSIADNDGFHYVTVNV